MISFKKYEHILVIIALLGGSAASVKGLQALELHQHQKANEEYAAALFSSVKFTDAYDNLECKDEPLNSTVLLSEELNAEMDPIIYPQNIDLSKPGTKQVDFLLRYKDDLGTMHRDIVTKKIEVTDKTPPKIELSSDAVDLWQYGGFDASKNITEVKDAVDGNLASSDELAPGKYMISSNVDTNTPGDYMVTIKAQDLSGNEMEKSFSVTVHQLPVQAVQQIANYAYSGGSVDYSDYAAPAYAGGWTNFDAYGVSHGDDHQGIVNSGGIAAIGTDYFHHNDSAFMNQFWGTQVGDTVTLEGVDYTCTGIGHGHLSDDRTDIYSDSGEQVYLNGGTHLITCDGGPGTDQRWIMYLEPNN